MSKANKILLIEDDPGIIDVYTTAFKAAKIDAEVIIWGKKAIERIKEIQEGKAEKPALVLLDLLLPDINGVEVLREIKENEKTKDINVFVLSNYANEELQVNHIRPDKFVLKTNITPTELIKLIREVISKR